MYQQHFGLTRLPFQAPDHSAELFASQVLYRTLFHQNFSNYSARRR